MAHHWVYSGGFQMSVHDFTNYELQFAFRVLSLEPTGPLDKEPRYVRAAKMIRDRVGSRPSETQIAEAFNRWWHDEGSGLPPKEGEDRETHMRRVAEIAWSNGAHVAIHGIAK